MLCHSGDVERIRTIRLLITSQKAMDVLYTGNKSFVICSAYLNEHFHF